MDAFLAHAIVDPTASAGSDGPEKRAARELSVQLLGLVGDRPLTRTWRVRAPDGRQLSLVVLAVGPSETETQRFARAIDRLSAAGPLEGVLQVHAVALAHDAFVGDLWTTGCATDLPALHWSPRRRLEFIRRAVHALARLHGAGIVHGCLCADNVLLDDDLQPVLAESGFVSWRELAARKGVVSSYAPFAAPEVRRGEEPDIRSDLWSVGHLIEELVSEAEVAAIAEVVSRCVAPVAHLRYATAPELVSALDAVIAALPNDGVSGPAPRRNPHQAERASLGGPAAAPSRESARQRTAGSGDPSQTTASTVAGGRRRARPPVRWPALVGAVALTTAMAAAFILGAQTAATRSVLVTMVVTGAALGTWVVAPQWRSPLAARAALVAAVAALTLMLDPVSWLLRAGALRRLHGGDTAKRAAVSELVELGRDFRGVRLAGFDLSELDLTAADFRGADLSHADLSGARLWAAELAGASLEGARLSRANLEETSLDEARGVTTAECDGATRLPGHWSCIHGRPSRGGVAPSTPAP